MKREREAEEESAIWEIWKNVELRLFTSKKYTKDIQDAAERTAKAESKEPYIKATLLPDGYIKILYYHYQSNETMPGKVVTRTRDLSCWCIKDNGRTYIVDAPEAPDMASIISDMAQNRTTEMRYPASLRKQKYKHEMNATM